MAADSLTIAAASSAALPIPDASAGSLVPRLAPGRFGSTLHDPLILSYVQTPQSGQGLTAKLVLIDLNASLQPAVTATYDLEVPYTLNLLRSGRWNWFSRFDQAVLLLVGRAVLPSLNVVTVSPDGTFNVAGTDIGARPCYLDLAVGNFDHMKPNPNPPPTNEHDPNLQFALVTSDCGVSVQVDIYDVNPQQGFPTPGQSFTLPAFLWSEFGGDEVTNIAGVALAAGDTRGRSLPLGRPSKVTVTSHKQPDIVLGIPPMHVDWINPVLPGTTPGLPPDRQNAPTPCVLNLTVIPSLPAPGVGFSTQYAFSSSASSNASRKSTTSYSFSTKESVEAKVSYGVPLVDQISVGAKFSAQQTHDNTVASTYNTYSGKSQGLSSTTGFADRLFYTETRGNIYYYPVLGQFVCPNDQPTCADSDKLPLHVQFSGPDMVSHQDIDATTQEWYQPIHEPGDLFSCPWTVAQLQQSLPGLVALTGDPTQPDWRGTDTSSSAYSAKWNQGTKNTQSSGSVSTNKIDASVTVAAQASIELFGGSGSASFEVNTSDSTSTLNTSTQTLDSSTGIQVNKPEFSDLVADNYLYSFAGYVLSQISPTVTLQTIPLTDEGNNPIDIQSTGPLTVAFLADPFQVNLPWWRQAYTKPDVGLNHPERWDWSKATQTATFNPADQSSSTPQDQAFYHIKGFFITPAGASGTGPQLSQATAGDTLQLQARVYNFSLADMAACTQVHAQFDAQIYENAQLVGDSFLIGEAVLGPIPGV